MHAKTLLCMLLLSNSEGQLKQDDVLHNILQGSQEGFYTHAAHQALPVSRLLLVPE